MSFWQPIPEKWFRRLPQLVPAVAAEVLGRCDRLAAIAAELRGTEVLLREICLHSLQTTEQLNAHLTRTKVLAIFAHACCAIMTQLPPTERAFTGPTYRLVWDASA